jgi:hypothetical protein
MYTSRVYHNATYVLLFELNFLNDSAREVLYGFLRLIRKAL